MGEILGLDDAKAEGVILDMDWGKLLGFSPSSSYISSLSAMEAEVHIFFFFKKRILVSQFSCNRHLSSPDTTQASNILQNSFKRLRRTQLF
jgi:hypothetical protein